MLEKSLKRQGMNNTEFLIYQTEDGLTKIDVQMENETVWLTLDQMAELFQRDKSTISRHIKNIFKEGELEEKSTVAKNATVQIEGERSVTRRIDYYNLDVIISVGYRVKSLRGTQFRRWALSILKEYLIKGFVMDDDRLKNLGGGTYWKELLERIRDIRSSEKVFYRQVLDLYATSVDYDPNSNTSQLMFKTLQNKIHVAAHGHTAAEIIFARADAQLPHMGLTNYTGDHITSGDITVAKNYLTEKELKTLNRIVNAFFDVAELRAETHHPMYMQDWVEELDDFAKRYGQGILKNAGSVSHDQAVNKAKEEYRVYKKRTKNQITKVEQAFLNTIKEAEKLK
ncbi:virulence RhuM family protein [Streptococcus halichoeri]|uniref:virulence RhuM family protein n=1 Tax=Streptococcus halichoeri TaxID=254785 RepID=UPI0039A60858